MRLLRATSELLEFRSRDPALAPLLVGAAIAFGSAALVSAAPVPLTTSRIGAIGALAAATLLLVSFGWPRSRWVRIDPKLGRIETDRSPPVPIGAGAVVHLVDAPGDGPGSPPKYAAVLQRGGGPEIVILADDEPGRVLSDLATLHRALPLPTRRGWARSFAPSSELPSSAPERPMFGARKRGDPSGRRRISTALVICWIGFTALVLFEVTMRERKGDVPSLLSLSLPALAVGVLGVIVLSATTRRVRLSIDEELSCEWLICGVSYARRSVRRDAIRGACLVSPDGGAPQDILLDTDRGPVSFPCDAGARSIADALNARPARPFGRAKHGVDSGDR